MQKIFSLQVFILRTVFSLILFTLFLLSYSCGNKNSKASVNSTSLGNTGMPSQETIPDDIKSQPFMNSDSTWGFTIYVNGKIYIHQQTISVPETKSGFLTQGDAEKTSELVVKKIKNHISPEAASKKELDSLGVRITKNKTK